jgi:hypothetical protein
MRGYPVFFAQNETATCCRGCISNWHGIEKGRALSAEKIDYVVALRIGFTERQVGGKKF